MKTSSFKTQTRICMFECGTCVNVSSCVRVWFSVFICLRERESECVCLCVCECVCVCVYVQDFKKRLKNLAVKVECGYWRKVCYTAKASIARACQQSQPQEEVYGSNSLQTFFSHSLSFAH